MSAAAGAPPAGNAVRPDAVRHVTVRHTATGGRAPHVVAILPRGEAIRNFVHTGALDRVAERAELTVISVVPDEATLAELRARFPRVLPLESPRDPWPARFLRDVLDMAHGRALWSAAAQERWRLRDAEADTPAKRLKRAGRKAACLPFATPGGVRALARLERAASRALCADDRYRRLYQALRPTLVFNASHVHSSNAIHAVQAAQWLGVPTAAFVFSWDNLTSQGRCIPEYDHYLVWNAAIRRQLLAIYPHVPPANVRATGTPQFDLHFRPEGYWSRRAFCRRVGADPARPIVLYSTGMAHHMPGEPQVVAQIADMLAGMPELGPPQLLVRVYPKDRTGRFDALRAARPDILFPAARWVDAFLTPTEDDTRLLTNTLRHAAVGVNVASTVSLELGMFDRPVVNVAYDPPGHGPVRVPYARYYEFDHYAPLVAEGAVRLARTPDEMRALLGAALRDPSAGAERRRAFIRGMFGDTLDGRSGERVADALLELAGARRGR